MIAEPMRRTYDVLARDDGRHIETRRFAYYEVADILEHGTVVLYDIEDETVLY